MWSRRTVGITLSLIGFGIALIAGLWLAVQASSGNLSTSDLFGNALVIFIPVALLTGSGIFMYIQDDKDTHPEPLTDVRQQRELIDILRERGQLTMSEAANILQVSDDEVRDMVYQLAELQIFDGYIDWEAGILYATNQKLLD